VLIPSNTWGGEGLAGLLSFKAYFEGLSIRYNTVENANEFVWRILVYYFESLTLLRKFTLNRQQPLQD
jgi:hypothetical protein